MKKRFLLFGVLSLSLLTLAACGKSKKTNKEDIPHKDSENMVEVITNNIEGHKEEELAKDNAVDLKTSGVTLIDTDKYSMLTDLGDNIYAVRNQQNYIGIYSFLDGGFIISPKYKTQLFNSVSVTATLSGNTAKVFEINYGGKYTYFDNYGNIIVEDSISRYAFQTNYTTYKGDRYFKFFTAANTFTEKYLAYKTTDNGKLAIVDEIPNDNEVYAIGDLVMRKTSELIFGGKKYYLYWEMVSTSAFVRIMSEDKEFVKELEIPFASSSTSTLLFFNNGTILQQRAYKVFDLVDDATSEDFDYSVNDARYKLETTKYNLLDKSKGGKVIDFPYKLSDQAIILNAEGETAYIQVTVQQILEDKTLDSARIYLMKENLSFANELTYSVSNFMKTKEGFLLNGSSADYIYDANLNLLTVLTSTASDNYVEELDAFVLQENGLYGIVDATGKVVIPFEYTNISTTRVVDGKVYATYKDGTFGILDTTSNKFTALDGYTSFLTDAYYKYDSKTDKTTIVNLAKTTTINGNAILMGTVTRAYGRVAMFGVQDKDDTSKYTYYKVVINDYYFKTNGTELTETYSIVPDTIPSLVLGKNNDVIVLTSGTDYMMEFNNDLDELTITSYVKLRTQFTIVDEESNTYNIYASETVTADDDGNTIYEYRITDIDKGTYQITVRAYSVNMLGTLNITGVVKNTTV